jgi:hypothetical protein
MVDVLAYGLQDLVMRVGVDELVPPEAVVAGTCPEDLPAVWREDLAGIDDGRTAYPALPDGLDDGSGRTASSR